MSHVLHPKHMNESPHHMHLVYAKHINESHLTRQRYDQVTFHTPKVCIIHLSHPKHMNESPLTRAPSVARSLFRKRPVFFLKKIPIDVGFFAKEA